MEIVTEWTKSCILHMFSIASFSASHSRSLSRKSSSSAISLSASGGMDTCVVHSEIFTT